MKISKYNSKYLFPRTSLLVGAGSVLNIFGNYFSFKSYNSDSEADYKAIESDWKVIGFDIENSTNDFAQKNNIKIK